MIINIDCKLSKVKNITPTHLHISCSSQCSFHTQLHVDTTSNGGWASDLDQEAEFLQPECIFINLISVGQFHCSNSLLFGLQPWTCCKGMWIQTTSPSIASNGCGIVIQLTEMEMKVVTWLEENSFLKLFVCLFALAKGNILWCLIQTGFDANQGSVL